MLTGKFKGQMDRLLLSVHRNEVVIPTGLLKKWKEVVEVVVDLAEKNGHRHEGRCRGNGFCGYHFMGMDCPADCGVRDCGNTLYEEGYQKVQIDEKPVEHQACVKERVCSGTPIGEYVGHLLTTQEYRGLAKLVADRKAGQLRAVDYINGEQLAVVAREYGNWTRLLSHSCKPNVSSVWKMGIDRVPVVRVYTLRDIEVGEVLTFDFGKERCNQGLKFRCVSKDHTEGCKPETDEALPDEEKDAGSMPGPGVTSTVGTEMAPTVQKDVTPSVENETALVVTTDVPKVAVEAPVAAAEGAEVVEAETTRMDVPDEPEGSADAGASVALDETPGHGGPEVSDELRTESPAACGVAMADHMGQDDDIVILEEIPIVRREGVIRFAPKLEAIEVEEEQAYSGSADQVTSQEPQPGTSRSFYGEVGVAARSPVSRKKLRTRPRENVAVAGDKDETEGVAARIVVPLVVLRAEEVRGAGGRLRKHICKVCNKGFVKRADVVRHELTHEKGRFVCDQCKTVCTTKASYNRHMSGHRGRSANDVVRRFPCQRCGKTFTTGYRLKRHMLKHDGVKNFRCTLCSAKFYRNDMLLRHVKVHEKQKGTVKDEMSRSV